MRVLEAYDSFVGMLDDPNKRSRLAGLHPGMSVTDDVYQEARDLSHSFQDALDLIFLGEDEEIAKLTKIYGIF